MIVQLSANGRSLLAVVRGRPGAGGVSLLFKRLLGRAPGKKGSKQLLSTVRTFVQTDSWDASRLILREHPELLDEAVESLFERLIREANDQDETEKIPYLLAHRSVLLRAREIGVEPAFAELGCRPETPVVPQGVAAHPLYDLVKQVLSGAVSLEEAVEQACAPATLSRLDEGLLEEQDGFLRGQLDDWQRLQEVRCLAEVNCAAARALPATPHLQGLTMATLADALGSLTLVTSEQRQDILDRRVQLYEAALSLLEESGPAEPRGRVCIRMAESLAERHRMDKRSADLDRAVAAFEQGLALAQVPVERARGNAGLGSALLQRSDLQRAGDDLDRAVAALEAVLPLAKDALARASGEVDLGLALLRRFEVTGEVGDLEQAAGLLRKSLSLTEVTSADWGRAQVGLGRIFQAFWQVRGGAGDRHAAIEAYEQLLSARAPDVFPEEVWAAAQPLVRLLFSRRGAGDWRKAADVCAAALAAATHLYLEVLPALSQASLGGGLAEIVSMRAYALAQDGDLAAAVEALETGSTRYLAALALGEEAFRRIPDAVWRETVQAAWRRVRKSQAEFVRADETRRSLAFARMAEARRDLHYLVNGLFPELSAESSWENIRRQAGQAPLVYLAVTEIGGLALVCHGDGVKPVWLDVTGHDVRSLLLDYAAVQSSPEELARFLAEALPQLRERVADPLAHALSHSVGERALVVTLIPTGLLALLPLHAAFAGGADDNVVTYAPSAQSLALSWKPPRRGAAPWRLVALGDPTGDSPVDRAELEHVARAFPGQAVRLLSGPQLTRSAVLASLAEAAVAHLATPSRLAPFAPLDSGFLLAGAHWLTLQDIFRPASREAFAHLRLLVASAGRTMTIDSPDLPGDTLDLPVGLLRAGVPTVVAAQWPSDPLARTLLLADFYRRLLGEDACPAVALHQAQRWLRDLSYVRLQEHLEARSGAVGQAASPEAAWWSEAADQARRAIEQGRGDERPYAAPCYWASFACYGVT